MELAKHIPSHSVDSPNRILVVDDDITFCLVLDKILTSAGYVVQYATSGQAGLEVLVSFRPDLIVLDVKMPGMDGIEFCKSLRTDTSTPILFISASDDESTILDAFDCGAADYVTKPLNQPIFLARVKAALQLSALIVAAQGVQTFDDGYLTIDFGTRQIYVNDSAVHLTSKEAEILFYLAQQPGEPRTATEILAHAWGSAYKDAIGHVYTYIGRLRKKIEPDPDLPIYINTVHGVGYQFLRLR